MQVTSKKLPNETKVVLELNGRFDFNARHDFKNAYEPLLQQSTENIIEIDMSGVEYIDSSSLGMLMLLSERAQTFGKSIILNHPHRTIAQILEVSNIEHLSNISIVK